MLTQNELKDLISYDPITGVFIVKVKWAARAKEIGEILGTSVVRGRLKYLEVKINKEKYYLHRLAFLYMEGIVPDIVDHIDGNGLNNSWNNLYNGTQRVNSQNVTRIMFNKIDQLPLGVLNTIINLLLLLNVTIRRFIWVYLIHPKKHHKHIKLQRYFIM